MNQIELIEVQKKLPEIIADLKPGEEVEIVQNDYPVARLVIGPRKVLLSAQSEVPMVLHEENSKQGLEEDLEDSINDEDLEYSSVPSKRTFVVKANYRFTGRMAPLEYILDDE